MNTLKRMLYGLSWLINIPLMAPELLIISVTESCSLECKICSIKKRIDPESVYFPIEQIRDIIRQAKKMGIQTVVLSGGEPFLVKEIFDVINYIKELGMAVSVTTNGFYDSSYIEKISNADIDHIHFSLDGPKAVHDEIRGEGSFERLQTSIFELRRRNTAQSIGCGIVVTSKNCNCLLETLKIADALGVDKVNLIPYLINNVDPQHTKKGSAFSKFWPTDHQINELAYQLDQIKRYTFQHVAVEENPSFDDLLRYYSQHKITKKCFAGFKSMIITSPKNNNDTVSSQVFFCQDTCGDTTRTTLKRAWYSMKAFKMRLKAKQCQNACLQFCHYI